MMFRSKALTDLAHEMPCMAQFPHVCNGLSVPCHSNEQKYGRGKDNKSHDCFFAACCPFAHDCIDGRRAGWDRETKHAEWLLAYIPTQVWLWINKKLRLS